MNRVMDILFWLVSTLLIFFLIPLLPIVYLVDRILERKDD